MYYEWFEKLNLPRVETENGRRYKTPSGELYESVTTFLGRSDGDKFKEWENSIGVEEARKVRTRAANRGTHFHNLAESYLCGDPLDYKNNFLLKDLFKRNVKELDKITTINAIEYPMYSDVLKLAGTVDCVGVYDGVQSVIDFKTSNGRKQKEDIDNYFLQTTIYSLMVEERYCIKIPQVVIIIAVENEPGQVFIDNRRNWFSLLARRLRDRADV